MKISKVAMGIATAAVFVVFSVSCAYNGRGPMPVWSAPKYDAESSLEKGDNRFVGYMGLGVIIPGVGEFNKKYKRSDVRILVGPTDALASDQGKNNTERIESYARQYNEVVLKSRMEDSTQDRKKNITE